MGKLNTNKEINTLNRKIELLEHAVGANAEVYYNLNYSRLCRESGRKPHNYRILTAHCFSSIK